MRALRDVSWDSSPLDVDSSIVEDKFELIPAPLRSLGAKKRPKDEFARWLRSRRLSGVTRRASDNYPYTPTHVLSLAYLSLRSRVTNTL